MQAGNEAIGEGARQKGEHDRFFVGHCADSPDDRLAITKCKYLHQVGFSTIHI